ncbi:TIGR02646 family protein, partial [Salmonella enterica subsp. enterica serovar Oranienburg]|nr:TIGR02646 family protein [Salmonella enterica subsp. enterica serovar Oranienburg]
GINAFGGHAQGKNKSVDMAKFIHCHLPDCSRYFAYLSNGHVVPSIDLTEQEAEYGTVHH